MLCEQTVLHKRKRSIHKLTDWSTVFISFFFLRTNRVKFPCFRSNRLDLISKTLFYHPIKKWVLQSNDSISSITWFRNWNITFSLLTLCDIFPLENTILLYSLEVYHLHVRTIGYLTSGTYHVSPWCTNAISTFITLKCGSYGFAFGVF